LLLHLISFVQLLQGRGHRWLVQRLICRWYGKSYCHICGCMVTLGTLASRFFSPHRRGRSPGSSCAVNGYGQSKAAHAPRQRATAGWLSCHRLCALRGVVLRSCLDVRQQSVALGGVHDPGVHHAAPLCAFFVTVPVRSNCATLTTGAFARVSEYRLCLLSISGSAAAQQHYKQLTLTSPGLCISVNQSIVCTIRVISDAGASLHDSGRGPLAPGPGAALASAWQPPAAWQQLSCWLRHGVRPSLK
jgi:hypothetical protein